MTSDGVATCPCLWERGEPCAYCSRGLPSDFYDSEAEELAANIAYELFEFSLLRWRREAQEARLNWYWQENQAYVSDRPRGARLWPHGCPNEKGWWMSGLEDLHWDYGGGIVVLDGQTGQQISATESFPHVVELHNRSARKLRNRLKREQRRAGLRPVCAKTAHTDGV